MKTPKDEKGIVNIFNRQRCVEIRRDLREIIIRAVRSALCSEKFIHGTEVNVVIVSDKSIREMNRTYRNVDMPTDVLSFPMLERKDGTVASPGDEDFPVEDGRVMLGDIVISAQKALGQSTEYGHAFEREMAFLAVHGALHLLGYDHLDEKDAKRMRAREEEILNSMGLKR